MPRTLVVDLAATSENWALPAQHETEILREAPPGWQVRVIKAPTSSDGDGPPRPSDESMAAVADAEIYYGFGMPRPLFLAAPKLAWVHSAAAGVGNTMYDEMRASDVLFSNSAGVHGVPIAEYVVAGVLHMLRGLDIALDQQRRSEWNKKPFVGLHAPLREMSSVRALILGVGGLGGETAKRLTALGARCTGVRRRVELGTPEGFERVVSLDQADAELSTHDVVVLAVPFTPQTNAWLTADRLDKLPASAIVVNVSRGALLDDAALAERIRSGRLRGAVLDVFPTEPLAPTSPLWQLRSVIVTPHISPVSPQGFWPRQMALFLENWRRYLAGQPLKNLVDKSAGY